jgi:peptidoglycan/LPS O-acetylase OafA/YrhL
MSKELNYRPEIDGLRTIAILGVIIFHLNPTILKGGFLGVDVFFCISGFLITTIIYRQIREQRFTFLGFWKRRFKRLYPALVFVVTATMAIGLFVLPQPERGALPMQAASALFSFANILLWRTTDGYWSPASENISLLHTWSLSLEEQFYIFFPIFIFLCYIFAREKIGKLTIAVFVLSLLLCVYLTEDYRSAAFYLLPTRMWELLIGGLLAIYGSPFPRAFRSAGIATLIHLIGLALIVISYFTIGNNERFPGYYPLVPCIGTFLLLALRSERSLVTRLLSIRPCVYVGKTSYSLYLWHWPIFVYAYYITPNPNMAVLLSIIFAMTMFSYHFVEQPFRSAVRWPRLPIMATASTVCLCFIGFYFLPKSPLLEPLGRFDEPAAFSNGWKYEATRQLRDANFELKSSDDRYKIVVIGSSHARVICKPVEDFARNNGHEFHSLVASGVGISTKSNNKLPYADEVNERRFKVVEQLHPDVLVVAGKWAFEIFRGQGEETLRRRLEALTSYSEKVIVLGQVPLIELPHQYDNAIRKYMVANHLSGNPARFSPDEKISGANIIVHKIIQELDGNKIIYVDPTEILTTSEGEVKVFEEGAFLYSDHHHVNDLGAKRLFDTLIHPAIYSEKRPPPQRTGTW